MRSFPVVMRGYARSEVDDLFARIDETLGGGPVTGNPVTAASCHTAKRGHARLRTQGSGRSPERRCARA